MRIASKLAGLSKGVLRSRDVSHPKADGPYLVEGLADVVHPIEGPQLLRPAARRLLCLSPGSMKREDFCLVDPTVSGRERLVRMPFSPSPGRVAPVAGTAEVSDLAAGRDGVAVHRSGGIQPQLAVDRGEGGVVDEGEAGGHLTALHHCDALIDGADGLQVGVAHAGAELDCTPGEPN